MINHDPQAAPGALEAVRTFLNTWRIPNDTRQPEDALPRLVADPEAWTTVFPQTPLGPGDSVERLAMLRTDLRTMLGITDVGAVLLDRWLESTSVTARLASIRSGEGLLVRHEAGPGTGFTGRILAIVVDAVAGEAWPRLKACPDCRWVFYDHTRNQSKVWCQMLAGGPTGRACGTIAKVRRYRAKQRPAVDSSTASKAE